MADCFDELPEKLFECFEDTETDDCMLAEFFWSTFTQHPIHILDQTAALNIYGEPEGEPVYTTVDPPVPSQIKLDPEAEDLNKYGYDRTRDALIFFSRKIMEDKGLVLKVGDRVDFVFTNEGGSTVLEHFEIHEISPRDFQRQTSHFTMIIAAMDRTQYAQKP